MKVTREELYERVWTTPMRTLAAEFGLSDVGLKKTCRRMRVPTPERGYWARKAAGQKVRRTPLPKLPASVAGEALVATFSDTPRVPEPEVEPSGPVAEQAAFEERPENRLVVPDVLEHPHRLVAASVTAMRSAKPSPQQILEPRGARCLDLSVSMGTVDRALRVYDVLIKALESRGHGVELVADEKRTRTVVRIGERRIGISISEKVDRTERPKPAKADFFHGKQYDHTPSGRLTFTISGGYLASRQSWSDGKRQRLEGCLNDIIVGLVATNEELARREEEVAARQRAWEEEQRRRREAQERAEAEAARRRALVRSMNALRKSIAVRDYVGRMTTAADAAGVEADAPLRAWLAWALRYADAIDPCRTLAMPEDPAPRRDWMPNYGNVSADDDGGIW